MGNTSANKGATYIVVFGGSVGRGGANGVSEGTECKPCQRCSVTPHIFVCRGPTKGSVGTGAQNLLGNKPKNKITELQELWDLLGAKEHSKEDEPQNSDSGEIRFLYLHHRRSSSTFFFSLRSSIGNLYLCAANRWRYLCRAGEGWWETVKLQWGQSVLRAL